jgi:lysyl-tRNA synthetase class 1
VDRVARKQDATQDGEPHDWVTRAADDAVRHAAGDGRSDAGVITVSSGASPSGRVHLGNLREFLTVHFVAEELRRRGLRTRHLHVWDDFDRFRKVPVGVDPSWSEHIGRPLSAVPDPEGCHDSWAEHFKAPLRDALHAMGVDMEEVSQTERYRAGFYKDAVLTAVRERDRIEDVLARHRTKAAPETEDAQEAEALADSVAGDDDEPVGTGDLARFPYKPYCRDCGRDTVILTAYDDETTELSYTCEATGYEGVTTLSSDFEGKLVWKVDWPMRWAVEHVDFEPAGMDHATPGSSFTVGHTLVEDIFGMPRPAWFGYGFVGFAGVQKMSSSAGGAPTAEDALRILEAPILRWLYVRRNPRQTFNIDFGAEVIRLYDEWDALGRKAADPQKRDAQVLAYERAVATSTAGVLPRPARVEPFRQLYAVSDVTQGDAEVVAEKLGASVAELEPRLSRAMNWVREYLPEDQRTRVRDTPDTERLGSLSPSEQQWIALLLEHLGTEDTTALVYGVPKLARGMDLDAAPTEEVKADQKAFFTLLYNLLVDADRGPRLPTLVSALGPERVRALLGQ